MTSYDYPKLIDEASKLLPKLIGQKLKRVLVNVVKPEFNVVYLAWESGIFSIHGQLGGEYIGIQQHQNLPQITNKNGSLIVEYEPFKIFVAHTILQVRQVGEAWNGHGYEFSFEDVPDKTMIIQSIYVDNKPPELEDCLRLGICEYQSTYENNK